VPGFIFPGLNRARPAYQFDIEATHQRLRRALSPVAPGTIGVALIGGFEGLSYRTLQWSHPRIRWVMTWQESEFDGSRPYIVIGWPGSGWKRHPVTVIASDPAFKLLATPGVSTQQPNQ
jgi:hypothetical protein